jgi:hypothetical protein
VRGCLGRNLVKIGNSRWPPGAILPVDHHGGHRVGPIVFILGEHIAKCNDMPYGRRSAEIGNSKWPPRGFFSAHSSL